MELMERFSPLMSEALHCSGSAEGLALPLEEIQRRLVETAEQERSAVPLSANDTLPDFSDVRRRELEMCRLAVYAWADEVMLHSPRPDAMSWMPLSLQCRYFHTTEGGQLFFTRLTGLLDDMGIAADEEDGEGGTDDIAVRLQSGSLRSGSGRAACLCPVPALRLSGTPVRPSGNALPGTQGMLGSHFHEGSPSKSPGPGSRRTPGPASCSGTGRLCARSSRRCGRVRPVLRRHSFQHSRQGLLIPMVTRPKRDEQRLFDAFSG